MKKALMTWAFVMAIATLFAQQTHWTKAEGFENNMNMSAVLYVDGAVQHLGQVEIGAFCGDECREAILPYEIDGEQVYFLTISGSNGDVITFRLWDHQTDSELPYECATFYSFVANEVVGEYPEWYPIHFTIPDAVYGKVARSRVEAPITKMLRLFWWPHPMRAMLLSTGPRTTRWSPRRPPTRSR